MKKEKRTGAGLFLCLHTDGCFFWKRTTAGTHIYISAEEEF
jgi:hypothetical protein